MTNRSRQTNRRVLLQAGAALVVGGPAWAPATLATPADAVFAIRKEFGERPLTPGRVTVTLPPISENGYSVALGVDVESPMTPQDHVVRIALFAEENPLALIARFELGPRAGKASVRTRIRMGGSGRIVAVAEMSDDSLWSGFAFSVVTLAACVI